MTDRTYQVTEIVGTSPEGMEAAVRNALSRAGETLRNLDWFEVTEVRGQIEGSGVAHWQVGLKVGYRWSQVGENVASGLGTADQVVAGWLASPHHCANIMTPGFRSMGVGYAVNPAAGALIYWTEDFATPRG